jgi:hypothetical protein
MLAKEYLRMRLHRGAASEEPRSASKCGKLSLITARITAITKIEISSKDINKYSQLCKHCRYYLEKFIAFFPLA